MSRIGKKPIPLPVGVDVRIEGGEITVKGKNGEIPFTYHPEMSVDFDQQANEIRVNRPSDQKQHRALHGLTRSLISNMVQGVTKHFERRLEIVGVGYQPILEGKTLNLNVGFANTVKLIVPDIVICELPNNTQIVLKSIDKQAVGQFAAEIRQVRPPEPFKGKGIRYQNEYVRRKAGKAFAGGA